MSDAIKPIKRKHIETLERRLRWLQAAEATDKANPWELSEIAALRCAIAELNELLDARIDA
jgi:hypothetical protein